MVATVVEMHSFSIEACLYSLWLHRKKALQQYRNGWMEYSGILFILLRLVVIVYYMRVVDAAS